MRKQPPEEPRIDMGNAYAKAPPAPDNADLLKDPKRFAQKANRVSDNPEDEAGASRHGYIGGEP